MLGSADFGYNQCGWIIRKKKEISPCSSFCFSVSLAFILRKVFWALRSSPLFFSPLSILLHALLFIYILLFKVIALFFSVSHFTHFYSYPLFYLVQPHHASCWASISPVPAAHLLPLACSVIIIHFALSFIKNIITSLIAAYIFRLGVNFRRP